MEQKKNNEKKKKKIAISKKRKEGAEEDNPVVCIRNLSSLRCFPFPAPRGQPLELQILV